jgi:mycofactocin system glycosyltransferase
VPDPSGLPTPSELHRAPDRAQAPLPAAFVLTEDPSTEAFDEGTVLLGGNPLRLFRISPRARDLVERWRSGDPVGPSRAARLLARRLVSAGAFLPRPPTATLGPDDVTVVVPVRDRPAQLERLLGALGGLACVVVDDASADPAATKLIAERHGARFVGLAVNAGPSGARNAGLAASERPIVAFVDSDCVPSEGWLGPLLGHFDDPLVAAVAPRIVPAAPAGPPSALSRYEAVRSSLDRGPDEGLVRPASPIPFVPSAAILVRSGVVTGPGLFDPGLRGGEDVDLVWRLAQAGWDVRYEPASTVAHDEPASLGSLLARQAFYGATAGPLALRHGDAVTPLHVSAWSLAVWMLALARRPVLAWATLAASVAILADRLGGLVRDPVAVAMRIAAGGTARAAVPSLANLARAWSPALLLGLAFRRTRRAAALALLVPALADWADNPEVLDPVRYVAFHVADDAAYGAGVWAGSARARTVVPLVPRVSWRARVWSSRSLHATLGGEPSGSHEGRSRRSGAAGPRDD